MIQISYENLTAYIALSIMAGFIVAVLVKHYL
jgi:hypothetical protein